MITPLLLASALAAAAAPMPEPNKCDLAIRALDDIIREMPVACERDSDCAGFFYRGDFNPHAVVVAKPGATKEQEPRLLAAQDAVRAVCKYQPAEAKPFKAQCVYKRCEDAKTSYHYHPPGEFLWQRPFWIAMAFLYSFLLYFRFGRPKAAEASSKAFYLARWAGFFVGALVLGFYFSGNMLTSRFGVFLIPGAFVIAAVLAVVCGAAAYLLFYPAVIIFSRLIR